MTWTEKLRLYWHDTYYYFASKKGVRFALTCEEAAQQVDVGVTSKPLGQFRFLLHLSLCQGCKNYFSLTQLLQHAVQNAVFTKEKPDRLQKLNAQLLEKLSSEKK